MRKTFLGIIASMLITFSLVLAPRIALAQTAFDNACAAGTKTSDSAVCKDKNNNTNPFYGPGSLVSKATEVVAILAGSAAFIMIIVSGIRFAISGGDSNAVTSARNTMFYALIGLAVAVMAQAMVIFVINKL